MQELRADGVTYKIENLLGHGLSSTVYRAVRIDSRGHSQQKVAIKILSSNTAVPWLRREFDALTKIDSPNCVKVFAWENLNGRSALVLELIDGPSLEELAREQAFDAAMINETIKGIQEGLRALQESGLFHGDLSPGNILIDCTGRVKLIDFGSPAHKRDVIHGTVGFLAPEIWCGGAPTIQSDLFALGLIEQDLKQSFRSTPTDRDPAKLRAFHTSEQHSDFAHWLNPEPSQRTFKTLESNEIARKKLAMAASQLLEKRRTKPKTDIFNGANHVGNVKRSRIVSQSGVSQSRFARVLRPTRFFGAKACLLAVCSVLSMTMPGQAGAPATVGIPRPASLEIRSERWLSVEVDGRSVGYAPLHIENIRPGLHHLRWRSADSASERELRLQAGQILRLTDRDLLGLRLHHSGKRLNSAAHSR